MEQNLILLYTLFAPLVGAMLLLFLPKEKEGLIRAFGIGVSLITFFLSLAAWSMFDASKAEFQLQQQFLWLSRYNISFHIGADGLSMIMVLLTTFLTTLTLWTSWSGIAKKVKEFTFFMLILEVGMLGVFVSVDLFLFYVFWEAMLIPMYFIIGIWGGEQRIYASIKFFIYTMAGSLLMLVAIIWLFMYAYNDVHMYTSNINDLYKIGPKIPFEIQKWLFLAFTISFAIKVPLFPFHTWLPDAHVQAPTAGSVILAGVLLKMGTYGLLRFSIPLFPQSAHYFAPAISTLAVIGIIYGALVAMVQTDMKKLVAYSSVAHLGFVVLGIFALTPESVQGAIIQMVNHGLSTGALFILVGAIYERTHTREIDAYGGIAPIVPVYSTLLLIVSLSSIGLPGLNGFIGEFLILIGAFKSPVLNNWMFSIVAASGVIFAAVYLLWMYQRVVFGPVKNEGLRALKDVTAREFTIVALLLVFIVWIGVYPATFMKITEASTAKLIKETLTTLSIRY
ncbi:MAG: NADH-quinone oxidoreductase subunit M [Ignavibacteria bacterium]|nr:NADH-quinone oxidoreductase subunit M [Ignavibacteria bacterium]